MSTLSEIQSAVTALPRGDQGQLLRFVAAQLRATAEDETDYLLSSPANREHLLRVMADLRAGCKLVEPDAAVFQ